MKPWYEEKRKAVEATFETAVRVDDEAKTARSPSGRYSLEIVPYGNGPGKWAYTRGLVRGEEPNSVLADVKRNYSQFPYSWCEGHSNGHDYLICGEDYQGQTIIELDTGQRLDYVPDSAERGFGFCWVAHYPSPDGKYIFVDGCVWACPYELILYDFSSPMALPYQEIKRWPVWRVGGFQPDGSFSFEYVVEVRKSDGKPIADMTEEELEQFEAIDGYEKLCGEKRVRVQWFPYGSETESECGTAE